MKFNNCSVAESDSFDNESGFDEQEVPETGASVLKFVTKFVEKVCLESGVTTEHVKMLHSMIPGRKFKSDQKLFCP